MASWAHSLRTVTAKRAVNARRSAGGDLSLAKVLAPAQGNVKSIVQGNIVDAESCIDWKLYLLKCAPKAASTIMLRHFARLGKAILVHRRLQQQCRTDLERKLSRGERGKHHSRAVGVSDHTKISAGCSQILNERPDRLAADDTCTVLHHVHGRGPNQVARIEIVEDASGCRARFRFACEPELAARARLATRF